MKYYINKHYKLVTYLLYVVIILIIVRHFLIMREGLSIQNLIFSSVLFIGSLAATYSIRSQKVLIQNDKLVFMNINKKEKTDIRFNDIIGVKYNKISDNLEITMKEDTFNVLMRTDTEAYKAIEKALKDNGIKML